MNKLKYIVDIGNGFAIFPGYVNHDDVGRLMSNKGLDPIGAGFIDISDGEVRCFGESISLQLKSRGAEDSVVIAEALDLQLAAL